MLSIEIDGDSHINNEHSDKKRQEKLESLGITFLRFSDNEIKKNLNGVVETIVDWIFEYKRKVK